MKIKVLIDNPVNNLNELNEFYEVVKENPDMMILSKSSNYDKKTLINSFPFVFFSRTLTLSLFEFIDFFKFIPFQFSVMDKNNLKLYDFIYNYEKYNSFGDNLWLIKAVSSKNKDVIIKEKKDIVLKKNTIIQKLIENPYTLKDVPLVIKFQLCFLPNIVDKSIIGYDIYGDFEYRIVLEKTYKKSILEKKLNIEGLDKYLRKIMIELFGRSSILNKLNPFKFLCYEVIDIFLMFDKQMNLWIVDINHTDEHLFYTLLFNKIFSINVYSNESIKKILSIYY